MIQFQTLFLSLMLFLVTFTSFAQKSVKVYRTKAGKLYSVSQKDSIASLGFPIAETNLTTVADTSYIDIEVLPKSPKEGSTFVERYKNKVLPSFELKTLDGRVINNEALQGKVVMINFWSTTCGPCIKEMPELNQLKKQYKEVVFLAPAPEDAATVQQLLAKHAFDFVILPNAQELFKEWGIDAYPKNFFVDHKGIIHEVKEGTPLYRETVKDEWQVAVGRTYSPILKDLITNKSK